MHNKDLYSKILRVNITHQELESFVADIDKKEFDIDNAFEKYYNLERILYAIKRYEDKEIDDKDLAMWMNAYNWIIMAGFTTEKNDITFQDWIMWEISDLLDSLSFFDDSCDWFSLDKYKKLFITIDGIYKTINDWKSCFARTDECGENEWDVVILAYNVKVKKLIKMYGSLDYPNPEIKIDRIGLDKVEKEVEQLKKEGFRELKYDYSLI